MKSFRWTCPHCNQQQTVVREKTSNGITAFNIGEESAEGELGCFSSAIGCSNPDCGKTTVRVKIQNICMTYNSSRTIWELDQGTPPLFERQVLPEGTAKPQPEYIPKPLRDDYYEACLIRELSPKASATLTRRCLQGMIRDFAKIKKGRLTDEITTLMKSVELGTADRSISAESVEAIDHVRSVGNIGAHMEKDINMIVEVDPGEAQALIELVEMLFDEWYGARERRKQRLSKVSAIADEKKEQITGLKKAKSSSGAAKQVDTGDGQDG